MNYNHVGQKIRMQDITTSIKAADGALEVSIRRIDSEIASLQDIRKRLVFVAQNVASARWNVTHA